MFRFFSTVVAALAVIGNSIASPVGVEERASGVSCTPYTPEGWKSGKAKIYFYDNNPTDQPASGPGFHAPTLPANATIASDKHLFLSNHNTSAGYPFTFAACSAPALSLTTNTTQSSCTHGSCYHTYTNYLRVLNPRTGHCLTTRTYNVSGSSLLFKPCDDNPTNTSQLWEADQQVTYSPGYGSVYSYGTVDLYPVSMTDEGQPTLGYFFDWSLARADNRSVLVVEDGYSQVGLSARLLEA